LAPRPSDPRAQRKQRPRQRHGGAIGAPMRDSIDLLEQQ